MAFILPLMVIFSAKLGFSRIREVSFAISFGSLGLTISALSERISPSEPAAEAITGHPNAWASRGGHPNPSIKEGKISALAFS